MTGGVNYVSNMFKSTFRSESIDKGQPENAISDLPEEAAEHPKKGSFYHQMVVWNQLLLFQSYSMFPLVFGTESLASGATNLVSNIWGKSANLFRSEDSEKQRKASQTSETGDEAAALSDADSQQRSPTEAASQKALDSAKSLGSFMFSMANKAGQTVSATAKQIKRTVESSTLLADYNKEQQDFIREHGGSIQVGEPPWIGCDNPDEVREQVLTLSQDKRNFVRSPPATIQFDFDLQQMLPVALVLLKEDESLNKMRFEIVPKLYVMFLICFFLHFFFREFQKITWL